MDNKLNGRCSSNASQNGRRSSNASQTSTVQSSDDHGDPLMRDCFQLQQRLLETEKSLQNLVLPSPKTSPNHSRITHGSKQPSPQSDKAPVLTLADLTPAPSEASSLEGSLSYSGHSFHMYSSLKEENTKLEKKKSSSVTSLNSSGLMDVRTLQKKLSVLREENSAMFLQNNKLLTELENTTFQLQQSREQLRELNSNLNEQNKLKENDNDYVTIINLKEQLENKNYAVRELEGLVVQLRHHIQDEEKKEEQERHSLHDKMGQSLETIELLSEKCAVLQNSCETLSMRESELEKFNKKYEEKLTKLSEENTTLREESKNARTENIKLQEQLANLKSELVSLHETSSEYQSLSVENSDLKNIVETQQTKLSDYEEEVYRTKEHMQRLEILIQKIQEDKLTASRPDSGIGFHSSSETKLKHEEVGSYRSVIADLKLQLAMKDTEVHKLQALVASNTLNQQKLKTDFSFEGSCLHGLRSELCSVIEHNRIGDKKQVELEQTITRIEEENSSKTSQIIELNERLSDKVVLLSSLEYKLTQRNNKLVQLQQQIERITEKDEQTKSEFYQVEYTDETED